MGLNREAYLLVLVDNLAPLFAAAGLKVPPLAVSVGFPRRARTARHQTIRVGDRHHVFIAPTISSPEEAARHLASAMVHAVVGPEHEHDMIYAEAAAKVGFVQPWREPTPSGPLARQLKRATEGLPAFPHVRIPEHAGPPRQRSRLRKYQCPKCGLIARIASDDARVRCELDRVLLENR